LAASNKTLYSRPGIGVFVGTASVGDSVFVGGGVSVGLTTGVNTPKILSTVGVNVLVGSGDAVGIGVLVGDGSGAVGVSKLGVGKKLGNVGVAVGAGVFVIVGVGSGKRSSSGTKINTITAINSNIAKPAIILKMSASFLDTTSPFP
jgi:hypothetical protein